MGLDDGLAAPQRRTARRLRNAMCPHTPAGIGALVLAATVGGVVLTLFMLGLGPSEVRERYAEVHQGGPTASAGRRGGPRARVAAEVAAADRIHVAAQAGERLATTLSKRDWHSERVPLEDDFDPIEAMRLTPTQAECLADYDERWAAAVGLRSAVMPTTFVRLPMSFDAVRVRAEIAAAMGAKMEDVEAGVPDWLSAGVDGLHGGPGWVARPPDKLRGTNTTKVFNYFWALVEQEDPEASNQNPDGKEGPFALSGPNEGEDPRLLRMPYTSQLIASLRVPVGRSRLMLVKDGDKVMRHVDLKDHLRHMGQSYLPTTIKGYWGRRYRVHLPLMTADEVVFEGTSHEDPSKAHEMHRRARNDADDWDGRLSVNMCEGEAWVFDNAMQHAVRNTWDRPRVHLVVDTIGSLPFYEKVAAGDHINSNPAEPTPVKLPNKPPSILETPSSDNVVDLTVENWRDSPPFEAMDAESAASYLLDSIASRLSPEARSMFEQVVHAVLARWPEATSPAYKMTDAAARKAELAARRRLADAIRRGAAAITCASADGALLSNGGGISLRDAVEAFAFNALYFECDGVLDPEESSDRGPCFFKRPNQHKSGHNRRHA